MYILLAVLIFGLLIFIHELGHFIVARLCGVKVLEFAIGMGPKLFSVKSKKSGTVYAIRLLPIGGFVNMLGEAGMEVVQGSSDESDNEGAEKKDDFFVEGSLPSDSQPQLVDEETAKHAYCNQNVWKRILISVAGPAMNLILGFILMFVVVLVGRQIGTTEVANFHVMYSAEEEYAGMQKGDYLVAIKPAGAADDQAVEIDSHAQLKQFVKDHPGSLFDLVVQRIDNETAKTDTPTLYNVALTDEILESKLAYSNSEAAGLMIGDEIVKVNNTSIHTLHELSYEITMQGYIPVTLTVIRNGERVKLENVSFPNMVESGAKMGIMDFRVYAEEINFGTVLKHTWYRSVSTVKMVFDSIGGLFSGRFGVEAVSGPVGITKTISSAAKMGYLYVIELVIAISINLGVMNLLPIPALDGGHLLVYFVEAIRRKRLKPEVEGVINFVGLVLMLSLAVIILIKDILTF